MILKKSIQKASERRLTARKWTLTSDNKTYVWTNKMERVGIIRQGIPYGSIEIISKRLNRPIKLMLAIVGLPQTLITRKKVIILCLTAGTAS